MKNLIKHNAPFARLMGFTMIFLICCIIFIPVLMDEIDMYKFYTLKYRLEQAKSDEEYSYLQNVAQRYFMNGNYESDFDQYWEFAYVESTYMQACTLKRAILEGDTSMQTYLDDCIQFIECYASTTSSPVFKNYAKSYLQQLSS